MPLDAASPGLSACDLVVLAVAWGVAFFCFGLACAAGAKPRPRYDVELRLTSARLRTCRRWLRRACRVRRVRLRQRHSDGIQD